MYSSATARSRYESGPEHFCPDEATLLAERMDFMREGTSAAEAGWRDGHYSMRLALSALGTAVAATRQERVAA